MGAICDCNEDTIPAVKETKLDITGVMFSYGRIIAEECIEQEGTKKEYHTYEEKINRYGNKMEA